MPPGRDWLAEVKAYEREVLAAGCSAARLMVILFRPVRTDLAINLRLEPITIPQHTGDTSCRTLLKLTDISKAFAGVHALKGVSFDLRAGEVHALVGENGAGKSTLIKVITGAHLPDEGRIEVDGRPVGDLDPVRAHATWVSPRSTSSPRFFQT